MRKLSLYIMCAFYLIAGINHFWHPQFYLNIMPAWIGYHEALVIISGLLEIFFGIMLIPQQTRKLAAWGIIILLITIFPANIQMMMNYIQEQNSKLWITIVRLPVQLILIWWAYRHTKLQY